MNSSRKTLLALAIAALAFTAAVTAQSIFATLTGTIADGSGAVVPDAKVTLKNAGSGDIRRTVTNAEGYFSFSAVPTGTYSVNIEAAGFQKYEEDGVTFTGSEKRNLNIALTVGSTTTEVKVVSAADRISPVDSGEVSSTLTEKQLQNYSVVGRSAAEFIKVLPGFAIAGTGTENHANFTGEFIGINGNGDGQNQSALNGAFAANGTPSGTMDITADGAHVSDPGCNCATPVNPNSDMIQELKVLTSNFSAENSKGPIVLNTIAKSGSNQFHGEAYLFARHYSMNANDWLFNETGTPRPNGKFFFPGGNIGGPVLIPGTNFNKNRDKLFFFSGFEYFYQTRDTGLISATVPTAGMRTGNFSPTELAKLGNIDASGGAPQQISDTTNFPGGIIPKSMIDPGGSLLLNAYPMPNANPNSNGGYNYVKDVEYNQPGFQWLTRVDYSVSDNTKLFVRYNLQKEDQKFPVGLWWRNSEQLPYYTPIDAPNQSQSISASVTHVFNPSLTNEFVFGYTYIDFQNKFSDPSKVSRKALGYPYSEPYANGIDQIPSTIGWGGEFAAIFNPAGFEAGGSKGLFADKYLPSVSDNVSKVWGTHTMKFGGYYEFVINDQPTNSYANGLAVEANWGGNSSGNPYADLLLGRAAQYSSQNKDHLNNEAYNTTEFFAQDSWKVTKRLTIDYGVRFSHLGAWYDRQGYGFAVFDPKLYSAAAAPSAYSGFTWNKINSSIPLSGFSTKPLYVAPRFGMAFDIFGTGKTVLRGGWGQYYYHNAQFTQGLDVPEGVQATTFNNTTFQALSTTTPAFAQLSASGVTKGDNRSPLTTTYSFTISQQVLQGSLLEVAYVGNQSNYGLNQTGPGTGANTIPLGAEYNKGVDLNSISDYTVFRPYSSYGQINLANHNIYGNYNSMQVSFVRQRGKYNYSFNYTYGKALGIVGSADPVNINNDYGAQAFDRRHIFNAAYSIELPSPLKSNAIGKAVVNGWQLSGITQIQSGVNLTGANETLAMNTNGFAVNGVNITNNTILGSNDYSLQPLVTCNPTSNLKAGQYINGNCFAIPTTPGHNGPAVLPEVFGPKFWNSDLSMFKNFVFGEHKKLQLRFSAYNVLNHPLPSFVNGSSNLTLNFDGTTGKLNNPNFGVTTQEQGHRLVQLAIKFYF